MLYYENLLGKRWNALFSTCCVTDTDLMPAERLAVPDILLDWISPVVVCVGMIVFAMFALFMACLLRRKINLQTRGEMESLFGRQVCSAETLWSATAWTCEIERYRVFNENCEDVDNFHNVVNLLCSDTIIPIVCLFIHRLLVPNKQSYTLVNSLRQSNPFCPRWEQGDYDNDVFTECSLMKVWASRILDHD